MDTRPLYYQLRGHIDFDHQHDTTIPVPCDYLLEKNLDPKDYKKWMPTTLLTDPELKKYNLVND